MSGSITVAGSGSLSVEATGFFLVKGFSLSDDVSTQRATLNGNAIFSAGNYYQLTGPVTGQVGHAYYTVSIGGNWDAEFEYYIGGGTGADALAIFAYADVLASTEAGDTGGYMFALDEFTDEFQFRGLGYENVVPATITIDDSTWHSALVQFRSNGTTNTITVSIDGTQRYSTSHTPANNSRVTSKTPYYFGFLARTGGSTNYHLIRNISLIEV